MYIYISNISRNSTEFFNWETQDCQLWNAVKSEYACNVYYWILLTFFVITHILPLFGIMLFPLNYVIGTLIIRFYQKKNNVKKGLKAVWSYGYYWAKAWHGHEIIGTENLPDGPAILISYHSTMILGPAYLYMHLTANQDRPLGFSIHKKMDAYKPWQTAHHAFNLRAFSREQVIDFLIKEKGYFLVAPGGMEEGRFSDNSYRIHFQNRTGYVKTAMAANAAIVPIFTRNSQEAFWIPWYAKPFMKGKFAPKKIPFLISVGGLPVKLTTIIGKPISYDLSMTSEEVAKKVETEYQAFIDEFQPLPGSSWRAVWERFYAKTVEDEIRDKLNSFQCDKSHVYQTNC